MAGAKLQEQNGERCHAGKGFFPVAAMNSENCLPPERRHFFEVLGANFHTSFLKRSGLNDN